jgi:hypothetical protein
MPIAQKNKYYKTCFFHKGKHFSQTNQKYKIN